MSKSIYDEAIIDAHRLRQAAEQAAKTKILEQITPRIRDMINRKILAEQPVDEDEDEDIVGLDDELAGGDIVNMDAVVDDLGDDGLDVLDASMPPAPAPVISVDTVPEFEVSEPVPKIVVNAAGDVNIDVEEEVEDDSLMLDEATSQALLSLIRNDESKFGAKIDSFRIRVKKFGSLVEAISGARITVQQKKRLARCHSLLLKEAKVLKEIAASNIGSQRLENKLNIGLKEMKQMSRKASKNIFDFLFEAEEVEDNKKEKDAPLEEAELVFSLDPEEEEDLVAAEDVDAAHAAIEDILASIDVEFGSEEEEEELEFGDEELEDEEAVDVAVDDEAIDIEEGVYEIDESVLRRELQRMRTARRRGGRRLREQEEAVETYADIPAVEVGDVLEVNEDDLINVLADELGTVGEDTAAAVTVEENRRRRRRMRRPAGNNTARKAMREAAGYKKAATQLKRQLVEMNLFNAKLLYANKLLQNKNLTVKQQRAIVEALDNAKTLREAKLLYKSLSGSLARRGRSGKTLSESVRRTLGSSSRSTRSAAPTKSGVETDRWAVLAGISKN